MNPRVVLTALVRRLEPIVGGLTEKDFGAWGDEEDAAMTERASTGELHFYHALADARAALASGDDAQMLKAALECPTLERTGQEIAAATPRRRGGAARAERVTDRWEPVKAEYAALRAAGDSQAVARAKMRRRLAAKGWLVKPRTLREHLK